MFKWFTPDNYLYFVVPLIFILALIGVCVFFTKWQKKQTFANILLNFFIVLLIVGDILKWIAVVTTHMDEAPVGDTNAIFQDLPFNICGFLTIMLITYKLTKNEELKQMAWNIIWILSVINFVAFMVDPGDFFNPTSNKRETEGYYWFWHYAYHLCCMFFLLYGAIFRPYKAKYNQYYFFGQGLLLVWIVLTMVMSGVFEFSWEHIIDYNIKTIYFYPICLIVVLGFFNLMYFVAIKTEKYSFKFYDEKLWKLDSSVPSKKK